MNPNTALTPAEIRQALIVWATIASADEGAVGVSSLSLEEVVLAARLVSPVQGPEHRAAIVGALCGMRSVRWVMRAS